MKLNILEHIRVPRFNLDWDLRSRAILLRFFCRSECQATFGPESFLDHGPCLFARPADLPLDTRRHALD